jgi:hypothetical protein
VIFAAVLALYSGFVPQVECGAVADAVADIHWADARFVQVETFLDVSGEPNVHAFIYELPETALEYSRKYGEHDIEWGIDRYATVIVGARYSQQPVFEFANCLPASQVNREAAIEKALLLWPDAVLIGYIYHSPLNEWFEFATGDAVHYLHAFELRECEPSRMPACPDNDFLSHTDHPGWTHPARGGLELADYEKIEDVPYALWSYGCSPTASSMILDYWDRRGYPRLVDYYFDRWDNVQEEDDRDLTNVHRELADGMGTDSMYRGGTGWNSMTGGHIYVTNSLHGYSFTGSTVSGNPASNYGKIIDEIDEGRPIHWAVGNYDYNGREIYHSICAIGYEITSANDSFVIIHNTWDRAEHHWVYQTPGCFTMVYPLIPGGEQAEDLRLASFATQSAIYIGMKYPVTWSKEGNLTSIEVYRAEDDKKSHWELLGSTDGDHIVFELTDVFTNSRINIEGYSGAALKAADGTPSVLIPRSWTPNSHFIPHGHVPAQGYPLGESFIRGNFAYVRQGSKGVMLVELFDDYIVPLQHLAPHSCEDVAVDDDWFYILGDEQLSMYDISTPSSPQFIKTWSLSQPYEHIVATDEYLYLGGINMQLEGVRRDNQQLIDEFNLPETVVTGLDVIGGKLYVSAHREGLKIYDLGDPLSPQLERTIDTDGNPVGVAKYGSTLIIAEKAKGIELVDLNTGAAQTFDPGAAYDVAVAADRIFVAGKNSGLAIYKITGSTSAELLGAYQAPSGSVEGVGFGKWVYVGCGFGGLFAFQTDYTGIEETLPSAQPLQVQLTAFASPGTVPGSVALARASRVEVKISDVAGRTITSLSQTYDAGVHCLPSLPANLSAGVYFITVKSPADTYTGKVVVVK